MLLAGMLARNAACLCYICAEAYLRKQYWRLCLRRWTGTRQFLRFMRSYAADVLGMHLNAHGCACFHTLSCSLQSSGYKLPAS